MFKFNFLSDSNCDDINAESNLDLLGPVFIESKEVIPDNFSGDVLNKVDVKTIQSKSKPIKHLCPNALVEYLKSLNFEEESILKAEQKHSDLLPAIYEGGLKIWECTYDLINYFEHSQIDFTDKLVLDLGCGAGILGIYTLMKGSKCWFQDYNEDVINNITLPNVLLNSESFIENSKFFSGDWTSFLKLMKKNYPDLKFDYIITSETIYNTNYYLKLHFIFDNLLKKDGTIFLAAKSFYFGVGGGIHLFQDFITNRKVFKYSTCWQNTEGVTREILQINFL